MMYIYIKAYAYILAIFFDNFVVEYLYELPVIVFFPLQFQYNFVNYFIFFKYIYLTIIIGWYINNHFSEI